MRNSIPGKAPRGDVDENGALGCVVDAKETSRRRVGRRRRRKWKALEDRERRAHPNPIPGRMQTVVSCVLEDPSHAQASSHGPKRRGTWRRGARNGADAWTKRTRFGSEPRPGADHAVVQVLASQRDPSKTSWCVSLALEGTRKRETRARASRDDVGMGQKGVQVVLEGATAPPFRPVPPSFPVDVPPFAPPFREGATGAICFDQWEPVSLDSPFFPGSRPGDLPFGSEQTRSLPGSGSGRKGNRPESQPIHPAERSRTAFVCASHRANFEDERRHDHRTRALCQGPVRRTTRPERAAQDRGRTGQVRDAMCEWRGARGSSPRRKKIGRHSGSTQEPRWRKKSASSTTSPKPRMEERRHDQKKRWNRSNAYRVDAWEERLGRPG